MIPCDLLPCMYAESFPCAHSILCCCHSSVHLLSVTLPCFCAECDAMDAIHDLPGGHQHPLPPLCALALQYSQLCLCLHHQWRPLPGLPHGCGVHEPGPAAYLVASGHSRLQPNHPGYCPSLMVCVIMPGCTAHRPVVGDIHLRQLCLAWKGLDSGRQRASYCWCVCVSNNKLCICHCNHKQP